jgi:hypothetical protein
MTIHVIAMSATTDDSRKWPRAAGDRHGQGTRVGSLAGPRLPYRPAPLVDEPPPLDWATEEQVPPGLL